MKKKERRAIDARFIQERFKKMGGGTISMMVNDLCFQHPAKQEVLDHWMILGCSQECREALKEETDAGLPFAKPTSGGRDPEWKQLQLFNYDEMESLINREISAVECDYNKLLRLVKFCKGRFGKAPKVPELILS